jgi:hypothetical protein
MACRLYYEPADIRNIRKYLAATKTKAEHGTKPRDSELLALHRYVASANTKPSIGTKRGYIEAWLLKQLLTL